MARFVFANTATVKAHAKRTFTFPRKAEEVPPKRLVGTPKDEGLPIATPGNIIAIDTETTGLNPWKGDRPFMVTLANTDGDTAVVRWAVDPTTREVIVDPISWGKLAPLLADAKIAKVFANAPFDLNMLQAVGFTIAGEIFDVQVEVHTLNPDEPTYGLKPLSIKYLNIGDDDQKELKTSIISARRIAKMQDWPISEDVMGDCYLGDEEACEKYGRLDAYRTMALHLAAQQGFEEDEILHKLYKKEQRVAKAIRSMEVSGVRVDTKRVEELLKFYQDYRDKASIVIKAEAGVEFNPNSPKQMTMEFFGKRNYTPIKYGFDKKKKKHTQCMWCKGTGSLWDKTCVVCKGCAKNPSCNGDFLATIALEHYIDENGKDQVKEVNRLAHALLYEGAAETMLQYVNQYHQYAVPATPCFPGEDVTGVFVIHPNYKQHGTSTGRLSASAPNMQNVASDESGKKRVEMAYRSRECFIPRPGFVYYIPDYSQIEIWMLFLRAGATEGVNALAAGGDAHENVAQLIWGDQYDLASAKRCATLLPQELSEAEKKNLKMSKMIRKRAKNLQFCKVYGGGVAKIAEMIGCSVEEAQSFVNEYEHRLPYVKQFMKDTVRKAKMDGYIRNAYGRKYTIDRDKAYIATNYDIQGSSADLLKSAMVDVHETLCANGGLYTGNMRLQLTIHDELLIEVHKSIHSEQTMKDVVIQMTNDYKFLGCPIRFPVGMKVAENRWSESNEVKVVIQ
jgi:DNA polymerase-1